MDIVYSVALLGLAVVLFFVFLLADRRPDRSDWMSDGMVAELSTVLITGLIAFGLSFGVRFFASANGPAMGIREVALLSATLTAYYLIFLKLAPRRRFAEYAATLAQRSAVTELSSANIVTLASPADNNGPSNNPGLPRAA
jgi:hypothetical protein